MNCAISSGMNVTCFDLKKPGGVVRYVWVGNFHDLETPFEYGSYLSEIDLIPGAFLYKLESTKASHQATWRQVKDDGNHSTYIHTVSLNLFNNTPESDYEIQKLAKARLFFVVLTNASEFLIYGGEFGIKCINGDGKTGRMTADTTATALVFEGPGLHVPLRFFRNSLKETIEYLDSVNGGDTGDDENPTFDNTLITFDSTLYTFDNQ